jgi:hypothetical protein
MYKQEPKERRDLHASGCIESKGSYASNVLLSITLVSVTNSEFLGIQEPYYPYISKCDTK